MHPSNLYFKAKLFGTIMFFLCVDVRLVDGTDTEGFLEIFEDSSWGALCIYENYNRYYSLHKLATVACRQLHLGLPVLYSQQNAGNVDNSQNYYRHTFYCYGNEQRLSMCNDYLYYTYYYNNLYNNYNYYRKECDSIYLKCSSK